jgi:DNA modification methylase
VNDDLLRPFYWAGIGVTRGWMEQRLAAAADPDNPVIHTDEGSPRQRAQARARRLAPDAEGEPMSKAAATWEHVGTLRPDPDNPVIHTDEEVAELQKLIADTVWTEPIVCRREDRQIIAGHRRLAAALLAIEGDPAWKLSDAPKPGTVPVRFVDVTPAQARRLNLASNALAKQSAWDEEVLSRILREMDPTEHVGIGFDEDELRRLLDAGDTPPTPKPPASDDAPEVQQGPADSQPGRVYELGPHRLVCGDSTKAETWAFLDGERLQMVWTDPPYGVSVNAVEDVAEAKRLHRRTDGLRVANDDLTPEGLRTLLRSALSGVASQCEHGSAWYVAAPPGPLFHEFGAVLLELSVWRATLAWVKQVFAFGRSDYHYRHESIFYGWVPGAAHYFVNDRTQDSVLEFDRPTTSKEHPTMKPLALVQRCIENSSKPGWLVGDPFAGSGTTLIACAETGRVARCIELDPRYCDVIRRRWTRYARERGIDPGTGALDG